LLPSNCPYPAPQINSQTAAVLHGRDLSSAIPGTVYLFLTTIIAPPLWAIPGTVYLFLGIPRTVYLFLIFRPLLPPRPSRSERPARLRLTPRNPLRFRQWPPGAQPRLDRFRRLLAFRTEVARLQPVPQQRPPVPHMPAERRNVGQRVVGHPLARKVAAHARPAPVIRPRYHPGGHRVPLDIAHRRHQMRVVHRVGGKTPLEQVPAPALAEIDMAGVAPMRLAQRR